MKIKSVGDFIKFYAMRELTDILHECIYDSIVEFNVKYQIFNKVEMIDELVTMIIEDLGEAIETFTKGNKK